MTELAGADRIAPGALEAWRRHLGDEVDPDSLRAELALGSLPRAFHEAAARYPERTALTIDGEKISHVELDRLAARVGGWLRARGVGAQERVVLCGGNSLDFVTAYLGILRAGASSCRPAPPSPSPSCAISWKTAGLRARWPRARRSAGSRRSLAVTVRSGSSPLWESGRHRR
jgi:non-ribosomal peptide synthetase component F